jgi:hypothetical protein
MTGFRLPLVLATAFAAGCVPGVGYSASVSNAGYGADLVYAAPGVQVIADYDEPIFFADGFYWRMDGANWYRSGYYTGGWVYAAPPMSIRRIARPHDYVRYRPHGWTARPQHHGQPAPVVRDHRGRGEETRRPQPPPPPARDHRDHRDHRK